MTTAAGLALALGSAFALNWGWLAQHSAASALPALTLRAPIRSLRSLFRNRALARQASSRASAAGCSTSRRSRSLRCRSSRPTSAGGHRPPRACSSTGAATTSPARQWLGASASPSRPRCCSPSPSRAAPRAGRRAGAGRARRLAGGSRCCSHSSRRWRPFRSRRAPGSGSRRASLYAAGDVATKPVVYGGLWLLLVPVLLSAHGGAFVAIQLGFQRAGALTTAGTASLLTNAVPIAAGVLLFHEHLPAGALGDLRVLAFVLVVVAAGLLARPEGEPRPVLPVPITEAATRA